MWLLFRKTGKDLSREVQRFEHEFWSGDGKQIRVGVGWELVRACSFCDLSYIKRLLVDR